MEELQTRIRSLEDEKFSYEKEMRELRNKLEEEFLVLVSQIHGDLNLENILVLPEKNSIRLIDFAHAGKMEPILHVSSLHP